MKKTLIYREATWVADSLLNVVEDHIERYEQLETPDDADKVNLACYKVVRDYLENMEFLKSVKF